MDLYSVALIGQLTSRDLSAYIADLRCPGFMITTTHDNRIRSQLEIKNLHHEAVDGIISVCVTLEHLHKRYDSVGCE